ncbi:MAG: hypothetical protein ACREIP_12005, partial [Alphaproteobacteria bacterium]
RAAGEPLAAPDVARRKKRSLKFQAGRSQEDAVRPCRHRRIGLVLAVDAVQPRRGESRYRATYPGDRQ